VAARLLALDWNYAYAFVALVIGGLAGFQAIYERYGDESGTAVNTRPGVWYLISRGAVPALFFVLLYRSSIIRNFLFGYAIGLGLGTEAILRSQIHIKTSKSAKGTLATENTFVGFFNLLEWYQKFILEAINTRIAGKRQKFVRDAVGRIPSAMNFIEICDRVEINTGALNTEKDRKSVQAEIIKQRADYRAEAATTTANIQKLDNRYRHKLGYWVYHNAGRWHGLKLLFDFSNPKR
jgi:hypothetical protein